MMNLIEALIIFSRYSSEDVISCEHDKMIVCIDPSEVKDDDRDRLRELSFEVHHGDKNFFSHRFGSC